MPTFLTEPQGGAQSDLKGNSCPFTRKVSSWVVGAWSQPGFMTITVLKCRGQRSVIEQVLLFLPAVPLYLHVSTRAHTHTLVHTHRHTPHTLASTPHSRP